jgi:hypothetical protein
VLTVPAAEPAPQHQEAPQAQGTLGLGHRAPELSPAFEDAGLRCRVQDQRQLTGSTACGRGVPRRLEAPETAPQTTAPSPRPVNCSTAE